MTCHISIRFFTCIVALDGPLDGLDEPQCRGEPPLQPCYDLQFMDKCINLWNWIEAKTIWQY